MDWSEMVHAHQCMDEIPANEELSIEEGKKAFKTITNWVIWFLGGG